MENHAMDEEQQMMEAARQDQAPRICRDIFDANVGEFIAGIDAKIAEMKSVRSGVKDGGDYHHTLTCFIHMLESAKIAAKAYSGTTIRDYT